MSDPIQRTSSVPVPRPQGIETGRNPNVLGSVADQTRLEGTTQSKADDFSSYLEKSATITE